MYKIQIIKKTFAFSFEAKTSRGAMPDRTCWFLKINSHDQPEIFGTGEIAPLPGLSLENDYQVENELKILKSTIESCAKTLTADVDLMEVQFALNQFSSSVRFAAGMALLDLHHGGIRKIFDCSFLSGEPLPINGLIWMADIPVMLQQAHTKIREGFDCIKFKVGGLNFEDECRLLKEIRRNYSPEQLTIRLDANGAFGLKDVNQKLEKLAAFSIHSIEQPLKPADWLLKPGLLKDPPIPVALDEQLIGQFSDHQKQTLLKELKPDYLVLKPGLIGGFTETRDWISLAESNQIGWWITSALESPVGLNAIAQFTSTYHPIIPQGLGTGQVFSNLFTHPLEVFGGKLSLNLAKNWGF